MKIVKMLFAITVVGAASAALARTTFDPARLGHMRGVLEMCGSVDRQAASHYLLRMKALIGDATKAEVAQATRTQAYQVAYRSVRDELSHRQPKAQVKACRDYLSEQK